MRIKVLLVDDHKIVVDGLRALLGKTPDIEVVGEAVDGRAAVRLVRELSPEVVIMDVGMPDLNGIEATRQILSDSAAVKIVALSMHSDRRFVVEMLKAGASGYLLKDCAFDELVRAIRAVVLQQIYLSPMITDVVVKDYLNNLKEMPSAFSILTTREREVLQLLAEGKSTKNIASILHVSVKTVETHRQQIMKKLKRYSVAELTKFAIQEGLVSLET